MNPNHPLVYELNTRCWLRELSVQHGARITLGNVPASEFERWQRLGFTYIWLMGVWVTGARSRACSRRQPALRRACRELMPDFSVADIPGSPFAIAGYEVTRALGGDAGLGKFRRRLADQGLKLVLDFVPNHTGLDHPWLREHPEFYVQSPTAAPGTFREETAAGPRWIAHGKDPFFPPWVDTAQLDYRHPATRSAMVEQLLRLTECCDGVRCDMAMLLLNEVFARTWSSFPSTQARPETEFWTEAIKSVREANREFVLLAEAYWDLEARLQELGFDYTYDKRLYDYLISRNYPDLRRHLFAVPPQYLSASAHFLENHDERRITTLLAWPEHRAASLVMLGVPGLRLLHDGQLAGATHAISVHAGRRPLETPNADIVAWYELLLGALPKTAVGRGHSQILSARPAWDDNPTWQSFVLVQWQGSDTGFDLVVVNLASHQSQCYAPLTARNLAEHNWRMHNLLGPEVYDRRGDDLQTQGLYLDVPAHGAQLFHFEAIA
jgi:hypothetical protein